jgi:autotransporter-associated beta strand protein/T5SS/PEP-CTERM-associated repeat protein
MAVPFPDGYQGAAMKLLHPAYCLLAVLIVTDSKAALIYWDGDTSTAWNTGANWVGGTVPANNSNTDQAGFDFAVLPTFQPNTGTRQINGIVIGDGTTAVPDFTISGATLTIGNAGIIKNAASLNTTITPNITVEGNQTWTNNSSGTLLISGRIANGGHNLTFNGTGFTQTTDRISGNGDLVKNGAGTLLLEGNSTYTGTTFIAGGTVSISAVENLGQRKTARVLAFDNGGTLQATADLSFNTRLFQLGTADPEGIAGTFDVDDSTTTQIKAAVSGGAGTGALQKTGGGTLSLDATNSYTGGTIISAGTLRAGIGNNKATLGAETSSVTLNGTGATLQLAGNISDSSRSYVLNDTGTIDTNGFDLIINGGVTGDGGLVKTGNGNLTINSTASHGGGTTIRNGSLIVSASGSITDPDGDLVVGDLAGESASIRISGGSVENNWSILGNNAGSTGTANMTGGSWTTNGNFYVGYLGSGTLELSGGNISVNIYQFHVGNEGDGTLQMTGGNLSTTNSYLGTEFGSSGNAILTSGMWINSNNLVVGTDGSATLAISGNAVLEVGGTLSRGAGGTIDLAAGGTLQIGRGGATGTLDTDIVNNGHLIFNRTTASTYSDSISGSGMLTKNGSGTLTLSNTNSYSGATTINAGTLAVNGSIASSALTIANGGTLAGSGTVGNTMISSGGRIAPGNSPGILDTGDLTLEGGGGYNWEITSVSGTPGTDWDLIRAGGGAGNATVTATPGSKFTVFVLGNPTGWNPSTSNLWNIIDWGGVTGFDANAFAVDTTGFTGAPPIGVWSLANSGGFLKLGYFVGDPEWSGGSGDWSTGFFPPLTNGADITFTGTGGISTNDIAAATITSIGSIAFNPGAGPFTLRANPGSSGYNSSSPLTLGGDVTNNSSSTQTFDLALEIPGSRTFRTSPGNIVLNGPVSGAGSLIKTGSGSLFVWSSLLLGGNIEIQQGLLSLNGRTTVGELIISAGAMLGGTGTIEGNVQNRGTVSPGNSIGTLTVAGDYQQTSSGSLDIEIASPSSFDRLVVGGRASLAGTLQVLPIGGNSLSYGEKYAFLQAGSISGSFETINAPEGFRGRFLSDGSTGTLLIAPDTYTQVAVTPNQRSVAKALDSFISATSGDRQEVSIAFDELTEAEYPAAFDQIAPGFYETLADLAIEQAFVQTQLLQQRLGSLRLGVAGFQTLGMPAQPLRNDRDGNPVGDFGLQKSEPTNWSAWVLGSGSFSRSAGVSETPDYRNDAGGFLTGADYHWGENFSTGLYAGYQYNDAKYNGGGSSRGNGALFGGYASFSRDGYYADVLVGGGYTGWQTRRQIEFGSIDRTARAEPGSGQFTTALNLGKDWQLGGFTLGPILGAQFTYAGVGSFTETGADSLDLSLGQQDTDSLRTTLGGRVAYTWHLSQNLTLVPEIRMLWLHEFLDNPLSIDAALDGGAGQAFGFDTGDPARDSVFAGAGVGLRLGRAWTASAFYNVNFGNPDFTNNIVSLSLGLSF